MRRIGHLSENDRLAAKLAEMNGWTPKRTHKRLRVASHTMFLRDMARRLYGSTKSEKFARDAVFEFLKMVRYALVDGTPVRLPMVGTLVPHVRCNRMNGKLKGVKGGEHRAEVSFRSGRFLRKAMKERERTEAKIRSYNTRELL